MNAVITGATRGMGRAIARELAAAGYSLAICSRNAAELENTVGELRSAHPSIQVQGFPADCSDRGSLRRFANFVHEQFTSIDVLVNNAGMFIPSDLIAEDDEVLDRQWALNLFAPYFLSKSFGKRMQERRSGHIINICSVASLEAVRGAGSYSVTKFALLGLTNVLRNELGPSQVKVTALIPGATFTSSWDNEQVNAEEMISASDIALTVMSCLRMSPNACPEMVVIRPLEARG
jgi:short-subunit dehydrogenase